MKAADITEKVATVLREECSCTLTSSYITEEEFICPKEPNDVIYKTKLFQAPDTTISELIDDLKNWVQYGERSILVQSSRLYVDPSYGVVYNSSCPSSSESSNVPVSTESTNHIATESTNHIATESTNDVVTPVVVPIVVGMFVIIVVIVALYIFNMMRQKKKNKYSIRR